VKREQRTLLLVILSTFSLPTYAQQATARLLGTITAPSGAAIASATISATNVATTLQKTVRANASGEYSIPLLTIGEYTVRVEAAGFQPKALTGIILRVDQEARVDVSMTVGSTSEAITVQAEAPLLVTDTSSVGQVIENKAIANMPLNGRAFWQLAQLRPVLSLLLEDPTLLPEDRGFAPLAWDSGSAELAV